MTVDVACVGQPFLDLIFRGLPRLPVPGEELLARELSVVPGAMANVAYALRRLGVEAVVCAPRGTDPAGRLLADLMAEAGVPWHGPESGETPVTVAIPSGGDRAFVTVAPPPTVDAATLVALAPRAVVVDLPSVDSLPPLPGDPTVYAVVGDPEVAALDGRLPTRISRVRALLLNRRELRGLMGDDTEAGAARIAAHGPVVAVTCGGDGAFAVEPDGRRHRVDAPRVTVEDSTGAGDLFTAAYVWGDRSGFDLHERLATAARYASLSLAAASNRQKGLDIETFRQEEHT